MQQMGLTIEEAAECTGIGRNTMRSNYMYQEISHFKMWKAGKEAPPNIESRSSVFLNFFCDHR